MTNETFKAGDLVRWVNPPLTSDVFTILNIFDGITGIRVDMELVCDLPFKPVTTTNITEITQVDVIGSFDENGDSKY